MIESIQERFNSLTTREKSIFFVTSIVLIWGGWDNFVYQPIATKQTQLSTEIASIKSKLLVQQQAITQIEALGKKSIAIGLIQEKLKLLDFSL